MLAHARQRCVQIPTLLIPAIRKPVNSRTFTTTSPCESKVGSKPLIIPSDVTFEVIPPPPKIPGSRDQPQPTVKIKGPRGEITSILPYFIKIDTNPALDGPTLSIKDATVKKQKSMWGQTYRPPAPSFRH